MTVPTDIASTGRGPTGRRRPNRIISFGLAAADWERLEQLAADELRAPELQARWIVLKALRSLPDEAAS